MNAFCSMSYFSIFHCLYLFAMYGFFLILLSKVVVVGYGWILTPSPLGKPLSWMRQPVYDKLVLDLG